LINLPPGCAFHPRCRLRQGRERCVEEVPPLYDVDGEHRAACHFHDEVDALRKEVEREIGANPVRKAAP
jgi:ABC-type antimicrobial peptide transport system ATPase subunit